MIRLARARPCPSDRSTVTATRPANVATRSPVSEQRIWSQSANGEASRP